MSGMIRQALAHYPHGAINGLGMVLFMLIFLGAVIWITRRGSRSFYQQLGNIPLNEIRPVSGGLSDGK